MPAIGNAHPDRLQFMTLHHTTENSASNVSHLAPDGCDSIGYDVQVYFDGTVQVGPSIDEKPGCHAGTNYTYRPNAVHCNNNSIGIGMQGCFGASGSYCDNKGATYPSYAQMCGVACVWYGLSKPTSGNAHERLRPHNYCKPTDCCGYTFTGGGSSANNYYNSNGVQLAGFIKSKAVNYYSTGSC